MKILLATALASVALLPACVSNTGTNATTQRPAATSAEGSLAASAGLNVASAAQQVDGVAVDNVVNTGLAVGMTQSFGGAGLGFGLLGVLAGGSGGLESSPHILTTIPSGTDPKSRELALSEAVYRATGRDHEREGFERVNNTSAPTAVTFIKEGCKKSSRGHYDKKCSRTYQAVVYKPQGAPAGSGYMVSFAMPDHLTDYEAFSRRVVNQKPRELSLYIPPKRIGGQVQPAKIYQNGKDTVIR